MAKFNVIKSTSENNKYFLYCPQPKTSSVSFSTPLATLRPSLGREANFCIGREEKGVFRRVEEGKKGLRLLPIPSKFMAHPNPPVVVLRTGLQEASHEGCTLSSRNKASGETHGNGLVPFTCEESALAPSTT